MASINEKAEPQPEVAEIASIEVRDKDLQFGDVKIDWETRKKLFWSWSTPRHSKKPKKFFVWYPANCTPSERKVIFKLDCFVLSFVCMSFFIKYLDYSNVSNAYVSGMQEAYNMKDADYNWLDNCFYICYAVFGLFGPLLMTRFPPNLVFPLFEAGWSIACILVITTKSLATLMVVRGIQGALEGIAYPSIFYILGSVYSPDILVSRSAVFIMSGCVGPLVGGLLQARLVSLDGVAGLSTWKWPFVIDFLISVPVVIFGYFVLPPDPQKRQPNFYLNLEEIDYIRAQTQVVEGVESTDKFSLSLVKRALSSWQFYIFVMAYVISQMTETAGGYWNIVLEDQGYNIYDRNNIPSIQPGVKAVTSLIIGFVCDWRGRYCEAYAVLLCFWISGLAILVKWDVPRAAEFYAYSIIGVCAPVSVIVVSWCNEMTREDKQVRAFTLGSLNIFSTIATTPYSIKLFDTKFSPMFKSGMEVALAMACLQFVYNWVMVWFDRYQNRVRDYVEDKMIEMRAEVPSDLMSSEESA